MYCTYAIFWAIFLWSLCNSLGGGDPPDCCPEHEGAGSDEKGEEAVELFPDPAVGGEPLVEEEAGDDDQAVEEQPRHEEGAAPARAVATDHDRQMHQGRRQQHNGQINLKEN